MTSRIIISIKIILCIITVGIIPIFYLEPEEAEFLLDLYKRESKWAKLFTLIGDGVSPIMNLFAKIMNIHKGTKNLSDKQ